MRALPSWPRRRSTQSARACSQHRALYALGCTLLTLWLSSATVRAQEPAVSLERSRAEPAPVAVPILRSKSVEGFGPDAQLTGGVGFGFEAKLENFFLARARLGALYAAEPWIVDLGFTAEVGALAGLGWGAELELSRAGTLFGSAGVARVDESRWLAHLGLGFTIFGLEWQHVFGGSEPHNALLLEVRLPLGLWWLHKRQEKAEAESAAASRPPAAPKVVHRPTSNPPPLVPGAPSSRTPNASVPNAEPSPPAAASGSRSAATSGKSNSPDPAARETELAARMAEAQSARERGDHLAEAMALSRAYALRPEPALALQLSAAELALGKPRSALADFQRAGDLQQLSADERAKASALQQQIARNVAQLRISLSGAVAEQDVVEIDGAADLTASRGWDVPLDPGEHKLQVIREQRVLIERSFQAEPGKLTRLEIELPRD